jgi:tetratricopeptide (TPR) repeat protein
MNKWFFSLIGIISLFVIIFINLDNNSETYIRTNTDLDNVSNEEMEIVIADNPDIFPMRIALANRYFDEVNYSMALTHFMYVAENSSDVELKSYSLAQIAWMVYESGNIEVATKYLNESISINPESIISNTYLGILYLQEPSTKSEGFEIISKLLLSENLSEDDRNLLEEIISNYEN